MQETYISSADIETWKTEWGGMLYAHPGTCHSKGQVILISKGSNIKNVEFIDISERVIGIKFISQDETF